MTNQRNETPEPLAQEQAGDMPVVAYLVTNLSSGEPSICFEDERGDYGDEDHMPVFEALVRLSDITAALQAKDAEIARLKADAGRAMVGGNPAWLSCETRRPWVKNSLREASKKMRGSEVRVRNAFRKDYMREPCQYIADAYAEAAAALEARLAAIDAMKGEAA